MDHYLFKDNIIIINMFKKGQPSMFKGRKHTEEWKIEMSKRISGKSNPFFGKKHSEEIRKIIGLKGLGRKHTETQNKLMSEKFKGEKNPFFGKHHTQKTIELIKQTQFKKGHKPWNYKMKQPIPKELHPRWKGGITPINHIIRSSFEARYWREDVFRRDNWTCQHCSYRGKGLNAHHIKPFSKYPELRFEVNNGITLCKECHFKEHKRLRICQHKEGLLENTHENLKEMQQNK